MINVWIGYKKTEKGDDFAVGCWKHKPITEEKAYEISYAYIRTVKLNKIEE